MINPIRKHGSYKEIEDAVFNMADGEISPVIHAGGQYVILQARGADARPRRARSSRLPPKLKEILRDRKMRAGRPGRLPRVAGLRKDKTV